MAESRWVCLNCGNPAIHMRAEGATISIHCEGCNDHVVMYFNTSEEADNITVGEVFDFYEREKGIVKDGA